MYEDILRKKLDSMGEGYDENLHFTSTFYKHYGGGYHTRRTGLLHEANKSAEYAALILYLREERLYRRAEDLFRAVSELQDKDKNSKTYGLWPYYMEEPLENMIAPDYNYSDFIGKHYIYALAERRGCLSDDTVRIMEETLERAMQCSVKRNVAPDYTNISMMSTMTILSAGELLGNNELKEHGKRRLEKAYRYNKLCGSFSEYNSSAYTPLAIAEITRMLMYFKDPECVKMAQFLHDLAWEMLSLHYDAGIGDIVPPQKRSYTDTDNGALKGLIYMATDGRYGCAECLDKVNVNFLMLPVKCPERFYGNFEKKNGWIEQTYYKQNDIRTPNEDTVIVRSLKNPDMRAFSYYTDTYAIGAFDKTDLWNQRRSSAVVWGYGDKETCFRLRCINGDYDYCSGYVCTDQYKDVQVSAAGFVWDHGDYHYILDKVKDGKLKTTKLAFRFELSGYTDEARISRNGSRFVIEDRGVSVILNIKKWMSMGAEGDIVFDGEAKCIELIVYSGAERDIDTKKELKDTYALFTLSTGGADPEAKISEKDGKVTVSASHEGKELSVCISPDVTDFDTMMGIEAEKSHNSVK